MRTTFKLFVVCGLACLWIVLTLTGVVEYPEIFKEMAGQTKEINWKTVDLYNKPLPETIKSSKGNVAVATKTIIVENIKVFYREAIPPEGVSVSGQSVLLLHGRAFSSETWEKLETLNILAALGHRVVAVDLPGYGNTKEKFIGNRADFMVSLFDALSLKDAHPVLVSPSMSGEYSVVFLKDHSNMISGYVPVAPVATNSLSHSELQKVVVPTLIVYGSEDNTGLAEASLQNLQVLPNSREIKIEGAGHPAYLNQPAVFHKLLHNFLQLLK
ncbi:Uncharacterized protein GBIM_18458 [Gryllus bimaculatus]|nr:Uncharacterized protein GBIM_18458 [Gryllus bimaculatus]